MGVDLSDIIQRKNIKLEDLRGKVIAIDAYNALYQYLAAIRQQDGKPLMNRFGEVTSHLSGLFYRTVNLLENGIKPVYVFDGKPPELKYKELERRSKLKEEAEKQYQQALEMGEIEEARTYAQRAIRLTDRMVNDAIKLLSYMGIPCVISPSEGEAQAAYIAKKVVLKVKDIDELMKIYEEAKKQQLNVAIIADRGLTQIPEGTITCIGIGPDFSEKIDRVTAHLKLL